MNVANIPISRLPLAQFLNLLAAAGFSIGIDDRIALQKLLANADAWDIDTLRRHISLVVTRTYEERKRFVELFDAQFTAQPSRTFSPPPPIVPRTTVRLWLVAAATLVTAFVVVVCIAWMLRPRPLPVPKMEPPHASTKPKVWSEHVYVAPATQSSRKYAVRQYWLPLLLGALPMFALMAVFNYRRRLMRPRLRPPHIYTPHYPQCPAQKASAAELEDLSRSLGLRSMWAGDPELDVVATVRETATHGRFPILVVRDRKRPPRLLVLIQTDISATSVRQTFEQLMRDLRGYGVDIDAYRFLSNPECCERITGPMLQVTFDELGAIEFDGIALLADPAIAMRKGDVSYVPTEEIPCYVEDWAKLLLRFRCRVWFCPSIGSARGSGAQALRQATSTPVVPLSLGPLFCLLHETFACVTSPTLDELSLEAYRPVRSTRRGHARAELAPEIATVVEYFRQNLGNGFLALCAATLLPELTQKGVNWLCQEAGVPLTWNERVRLLGIPWLVAERWPERLEAALRGVLWVEYPKLAERVRGCVGDLLDRNVPAPDTGARLAYEFSRLEFELKANYSPESTFNELVRGPESVRRKLARSVNVREWLELHPRQRRRLRLASLGLTGISALVVGIWVCGALATVAVQTRGAGLSNEMLRQLESLIAARGAAVLEGCYERLSSADWDKVASRMYQDLVQVRVTLVDETAGPDSKPGVNSPINSSEWQGCVEQGYATIAVEVRQRGASASHELSMTHPSQPKQVVEDQAVPEPTTASACGECLNAIARGDLGMAANKYRQCNDVTAQVECRAAARTLADQFGVKRQFKNCSAARTTLDAARRLGVVPLYISQYAASCADLDVSCVCSSATGPCTCPPVQDQKTKDTDAVEAAMNSKRESIQSCYFAGLTRNTLDPSVLDALSGNVEITITPPRTLASFRPIRGDERYFRCAESQLKQVKWPTVLTPITAQLSMDLGAQDKSEL